MKVNGFLPPAWRYLFPVGLALASLGATAQDYPTRSMRLIVSALPGGSPDWTARILAGQIRKGDIRALFVTEAHRMAELPDVPTLREVGLPGDFEINTWVGLFATAKLKPELLKKIHALFVEAVGKEEVATQHKGMFMNCKQAVRLGSSGSSWKAGSTLARRWRNAAESRSSINPLGGWSQVS